MNCPRCGFESVDCYTDAHDGQNWFYINCPDCGRISTGSGATIEYARQLAIKRWERTDEEREKYHGNDDE